MAANKFNVFLITGILAILVILYVHTQLNVFALPNISESKNVACESLNCWLKAPSSTKWYTILLTIYASINITIVVAIGLRIARGVPLKKSPNLYIAIAYICSIFQIMRIAQLFISTRNMPIIFGVFITRFIIFLYALHTLIWLLLSIESIHQQFKKNRYPIFFCIIISFSIAYVIPVDRHILLPFLINKTGYFNELRGVVHIIYVVTIINLCVGCFKARDRLFSIIIAIFVLNAVSMFLLFREITNIVFSAMIIISGIATFLILKNINKLNAQQER